MRERDRRAKNAARGVLLPLAVAAVLVASVPVVFASAKGSSGSKVTTTAALRKAHWASNVSVSFSNGSFRFRSDGVPQSGVQSEYAVPNPGVVVPNATNSHVAPSSEVVKQQHYDVRITTTPRRAKKVTSVFTGPVGVMIDGALVFNPYEGDGETVAMASNFTLIDKEGHEVPFLDECNGHPSPGPVYAYHYHGLPSCVTSMVDEKNGPSHIIGVAFDGFPIYGDRDIHGRKIRPTQLDRCNGITSPTPEFPHGIYHYVLLDIPAAKSSIDCFSGEVESLPDGSFRPPASGRGIGTFICGLPTESDRLPQTYRATSNPRLGSTRWSPARRFKRQLVGSAPSKAIASGSRSAETRPTSSASRKLTSTSSRRLGSRLRGRTPRTSPYACCHPIWSPIGRPDS
jgi:hypothetical protein